MPEILAAPGLPFHSSAHLRSVFREAENQGISSDRNFGHGHEFVADEEASHWWRRLRGQLRLEGHELPWREFDGTVPEWRRRCRTKQDREDNNDCCGKDQKPARLFFHQDGGVYHGSELPSFPERTGGVDATSRKNVANLHLMERTRWLFHGSTTR